MKQQRLIVQYDIATRLGDGNHIGAPPTRHFEFQAA